MARPHILIIPPWFDIDFGHHFSKNYHRWARDLAERGETEVGLLYGEFSTGFRQRRIYQNTGINYHYLGASDWGLPKTGPGWWVWKRHYLRAFSEYVTRYGMPTVIHGYSLLGVIAAGTIRAKYHVPYVYTEVLGSFITGQAADRLVSQAASFARQASMVCGISPGMVDALNKTYSVASLLIPLYVDPEVFTLSPMPAGPPHFLSIGSPAHTKGLDILMEAMHSVVQIHPQARLTIVAEPRDKEALKRWVGNFGLDGNIEFPGPVPHDEIPGLIRGAHVLVSASRIESLGFTMIEAIVSGRPVVATATPGGEFIVTERTGRLVPVSEQAGEADPQVLAQAMINVYENREAFSPTEMREDALSRFGKTHILDQWMDHYFKISNQPVK